MAYKSKWSDLPWELLDEVVDRMEVPSDSWHLRSVCSSWRSALPPRVFPDPSLPTHHLIAFQPGRPNIEYDYDDGSPDDSNISNHQGCHLHLARHTFLHLSLPESRLGEKNGAGWLIKTEEQKPGVFHLFNPFSRTRTARPIKLDVTSFRIRELGYEYVLHNVHDGYDNHTVQDLHNMEHQKVALMKLHADSYAILSTHDTGKLLFHWSPSKSWSFLDQFSQLGYDDHSIFVNDWSLYYVDVVEYKGLFYAVTNSGRTVAIKAGAEGSSPVEVTLLTKSIIGGDKKCLVKLADDLLMVDLYTCPSPGTESLKVNAVDIFRLDTKQGRWVLVKDLGDHALFLSNQSCFSVPTSALSGCRSNCIYFHFRNHDKEFHREKDYINSDGGSGGGDDGQKSIWTTKEDINVFDFEGGIHGSIEEYLGDSDLFSWPPPSWIGRKL